MAKQIVFTSVARNKMLKGIDTLARAVQITLGAKGSAVVIQHRTDGIAPVFTRDGVTVANAIQFRDRFEDIGARMLRDVASATSRQSGDGTTTAVVLARGIAREASKHLATGAEPISLKRGMDKAISAVIEHLHSIAQDADPNRLKQVCQCASKESSGVADLLLEAMAHVGQDGTVAIELGHGLDDEIELGEGVNYEQGYFSSYFSTDKERSIAELDRPYILLYDREILDFMDLVPILEEVNETGRSLLIIAENIDEKALAPLLLNHVRGTFKVVAVKPPGYGDKRIDRLLDLALLTGGTACLESQGGVLDRVKLVDLGECQKVVVGAESTTIVGTRADLPAVKELIRGLECQAAEIRTRKPGVTSATANQHELDEIEERIRHLLGRTAIYRIGGSTDSEIRERLIRVENAYNAMRSALVQGVLPGGGVALHQAADVLDTLQGSTETEEFGIDVIDRALSEPLRGIVSNAGLNPEEVIARIRLQKDKSYGFDADSMTMGNLLDLGVVDPVAVTVNALSNAARIVGTVITTEVIISESPIMDRFPNSQAVAEWAAATREDPRAP